MIFTTGKVFIDTNILVYAYDPSEPEKQEKAIAFLDQLVSLDQGLISTQVLSEFYATITGKISDSMTAEEAAERIKNFCQVWQVLPLNEIIVLEAVRGVQTHSFSYWDSMIWATARLNQIAVIASEDFSHGSFIEGIRFLDPLRAYY